MDSRTRVAAGQRTYEDFVPSLELIREEGADILRVNLTGFKKEQIKVQIDNYGKLRISGERPLAGNRWSRFLKDYQVPENCNVGAIRAKFENGHLYITLPKLITEASIQDQPTQPQKPTVKDQTALEPPKPSVSQEDTSQKAAATRPSEKLQEEKKGEVVDGGKDMQKVAEKEKDQIKEPKASREVTSDVTHREAADAEKKAALAVAPEQAVSRSGLERLKLTVGGLGVAMYKHRRRILNVAVAIVILVGVGLYVADKLREPADLQPMEKDTHEL